MFGGAVRAFRGAFPPLPMPRSGPDGTYDLNVYIFPHAGDRLAVAHITAEGLELLQPEMVTATHVVVNVTGLSPFGLLEKVLSLFQARPKLAQVRKGK